MPTKPEPKADYIPKVNYFRWGIAICLFILIFFFLPSELSKSKIPSQPNTISQLSGLFGGTLIFIGIFFLISVIITLAVLAYSISRIYDTEFSLFKALLVIIVQWVIWFVIGVILFFILGGSLLSILSILMK
jgi:hypothetical protein